MANDFSWKRDIKNVDWQSTLKYNLMRSAAAGIVWGVLMLVTDPAHNVLPAIFAPVSFAVGYLIFFLPFGLAASAAARLPIPYAGLVAGCIAALLSLMIAVGDPLVYLLFKRKPEWIPVDHPGVFNFRLIIFIIGDPSLPRPSHAASPVPPPQPVAPTLAASASSDQTVAPSSQGSPVSSTQSDFAPQSATSFFRSKPFVVLVIAAVVLCGGVALLKSLSEKTALSFDFSLDGKALSGGKVADVMVDGQPFTSGSKIGVGRHAITVQLQDSEPLDQHFWILFGAKNLGTLPLETSKGSLTVTVNPSPANVVVRRAGEIVRQGEAPLNVEKLPIGAYMLVIRRGEYEETQSVNVQRQQRAEAKVDLKLGSTDLSAEPADAEFELSGGGRHWQGKLPMRVNDVPVGSYSLVARRKGWELTGDVSVSRGNVTTNRIEFPYGSIDVTSEPSGLVVSTNGVEVGKTPAALRELRPGSYEVTASDGENDLAATISIGSKENVKKAFVFRYGAVQLASTPPGAAVLRKGKEVGKTPLTLERFPAGESAVELRFDGYASTNFTIVGLEGVTTNYNVKLMSVRYLESMKQAREAFDASQFSESQRFLVSALAAEPSDPVAVALQGEVSKAIVKAEETRKEAERKAQEAAQAAEKARLEAAKKQEEALRAEEANAKAQALASMPWLDFQKVMSDCTDTKQVQYPVVMDVGSYQTYRDSDGKYKQRWVKTGQTTEMHTKTEATFNPVKFSAQYAGRTLRFNCPDKWSVSKVEKEGGIILKAGGVGSDEIRATAPTSNRDALVSVQKGQKVTIKGVLRKYEKGFLVRTLYLEDAELLEK